MEIQVRDFLPSSWWDAAVCVDKYETGLEGSNFPDLRKLAAHVSPENRPAAIAELAVPALPVVCQSRPQAESPPL